MADKDFNVKFESLPLEAQRQVLSFIDFLQQKYLFTQKKIRKGKSVSAGKKFVGMWKDREDLKDSSLWIRSLRKRDWEELAE